MEVPKMTVTRSEIEAFTNGELGKFGGWLTAKANLALKFMSLFPQFEEFEFNKEQFYHNASPALTVKMHGLKFNFGEIVGLNHYLIIINSRRLSLGRDDDAETVADFMRTRGLEFSHSIKTNSPSRRVKFKDAPIGVRFKYIKTNLNSNSPIYENIYVILDNYEEGTFHDGKGKICLWVGNSILKQNQQFFIFCGEGETEDCTLDTEIELI
jgi:hypothetical protein